ncbi:hypothetical protein P7K49_013353 [Saguinus oedipus]|uniref:Uncharacterized protein n=1 Tax=Saguinus oedipus TaxID=9490 RepID=A0ABQ9VHS8_SAGOE|nr:hypothetical protein P7K49_013353 [Saguinus oedipus]
MRVSRRLEALELNSLHLTALLLKIKKLKGQLEERQKIGKLDDLRSEDDVLENGTDMHAMDLQRDANRQISDLKFKLAKSEQEITALEQNTGAEVLVEPVPYQHRSAWTYYSVSNRTAHTRGEEAGSKALALQKPPESQVSRYKSAAENAEKIEDELKAEKRKLQREEDLSINDKESPPFTLHEELLHRGTSKTAALATRVALATHGAPSLAIFWSDRNFGNTEPCDVWRKPVPQRSLPFLYSQLRSALDKTEELEVSNGHLVKRLEKMKANRSALLSQQ